MCRFYEEEIAVREIFSHAKPVHDLSYNFYRRFLPASSSEVCFIPVVDSVPAWRMRLLSTIFVM